MGVLVGASLPRTLRFTEVDLTAGVAGEFLVLSHFAASIPCQRPARLLWELEQLHGNEP